MKEILIYYGTEEGQTAKISEFLARTLSNLGFAVHLVRASDGPLKVDAQEYCGAILGSSVHLSRFSGDFRDGVLSQKMQLASMPLAFFSVCLGILENSPDTLKAEMKILSDFIFKTGLHPLIMEIFPGAIRYSQYGWFKKRILRRIARKAGVDTTFDRDYEYTDWEKVTLFACRFAEALLERGNKPVARFPKAFSLSQ